jgi:hypothetical protein
MTKAIGSDTRLEIVKRKIVLSGIKDIMFDRYAGDNSTKLDWTQKIYLPPESDILSLPTINIVSFLSSHNTNSAPKRLRPAKEFKKIANACLSFTTVQYEDVSKEIGKVEIGYMGVDPNYIPFTRNGEPIRVGTFGAYTDELSGLYLTRHVARLDKGIPNSKERPVLPLPWELSFTLSIFPNKEIKEQEIMNLFVEGGIAIGLGTFRGVYGKFEVKKWE